MLPLRHPVIPGQQTIFTVPKKINSKEQLADFWQALIASHPCGTQTAGRERNFSILEVIMKKWFGFLAVLFFFSAHPALAQQAGQANKLDRAQVDALLAKPEQLVIIDVRRPDELTRIGGFPVYLSIQSRDLEKSLAYIPKDRSIVTVSNHAARAIRSANLLAEKGFRVVGAVGAQDYEAEGGTLSKIEPPPPRAAANGQDGQAANK
jgi:rhodanese-related sulfurtransferase